MSQPRPLVLVAEQFDGAIRKSSLQALAAARRLAQATGAPLRVLAIGADAASAAAQLGAHGVASVEFVRAADGAARNASAIVPELAKAIGAAEQIVLLGMSDLAADVAPRLAARLGGAYIADATAIEVVDGAPRFRRPIYAGKALEQVEILGKGAVATLRANAFPTPDSNGGGAAQVVELGSATGDGLKAVVKDIVKKSGLDAVSLTEADIIVSGGIGVGGPEGYEPLKKLCSVLGAALGASRAAVHAGWIEESHQVGQTGKTVSPNLYIACGISGAIQHQAGMRTSRCIVAVNTDPSAPIFQLAHYGIVGDVKQVVPELAREFEAALRP
ncbi:MAG: electron transfer flavoprotein subunit alpha/FixB family protein [Candidatus Sumerlaeia bacterium]|nr:electron transfer flavoprotein subunit alpha/FixB family protein [Candidatus Sumerlaeia bacterium]